MVSKKIECAVCNKKCSGNVLKYKDLFYHKQCKKLLDKLQATKTINNNNNNNIEHQQQQRSTFRTINANLLLSDSHVIEIADEPSLTATPPLQNPTTTTSTTTTSKHHKQTNITIQYQPRLNENNLSNSNNNSNNNNMAIKSHNKSSNNVVNEVITNGHSTLNRKSTVNYQTNTKCAECKEIIKDAEALKALDRHFHVRCFKCTSCRAPLHGEYVAKDGKAYCEKDYQKLFGVTCVYCKRYITGKVLQAGENHHFHPSCARCSKCGDPFVPGEEMYLQGEITWHPRCGVDPDTAGLDEIIGNHSSYRDSHLHASSPSLISNRSRSASPFSYMSRQYGRTSPYADSEAVGDLSRIYTISYLNSDPSQGYLRRPIEPRPPKSPQFSRPMSLSRDRPRSSTRSLYDRDRSAPRSGMSSILQSMRSSLSARARSPSMQNEEAIQLSHYPAAKKPNPNEPAKIERDDFPAPPYAYGRNVENHRQHNSTSTRASRPKSREISSAYLNVESSEDEDINGNRHEREISKIASGIGKVFLDALKEREKIKAWKRNNLDPRNASRTPSATRELPSRLRYENPRNASPSRELDRPRVWDDDDDSSFTRGSRARSASSLLAPKPPFQTNSVKLSAPKIYPYHLLITSNYRLPADVDRCHLERHLSTDEFIAIFHCDRSDFYRLPEWKRNELKRRALLF